MRRLGIPLGLGTCRLCDAGWSGSRGCCERCARELRDQAERALELPGLTALGHYRGVLSSAVKALKYGRAHRLAGVLSLALAAAVESRRWSPRLVTSVPPNTHRLRERGFDPSRLLAHGVARQLGLPCVAALRRLRSTPQQSRLDARARRANTRGAFASVGRMEGPVLVVDDVFTTGATLGACRDALEAAGANPVLLAVIAVTTPRSTPGDSENDVEIPDGVSR